LARQDGEGGKRKESHATKVTKILKTKRQKYGMNQNNIFQSSTIDSFSNPEVLAVIAKLQ
jgi:hypothetical protein